MNKKICYLAIIIFLITTTIIASDCKIRLVLGSDTAIWDGLSTSRFNNTYNPALYTDPEMNGYQVMSDEYRSKLVDSYGTPMKLTWWMMCGQVYRYATNTDCPIPNIMTMYHMKQHHLPAIEQWNDELTLHYHTFLWSDYDNDGRFWWNQALTFEESQDDFDYTLCQLLIEEENFFVSFRSGWHFMDNEWQTYLNELMPFSMHNALGSYKNDPTEPTNNNIDWRIAPDQWIPYQPDPDNYQLPGGNSGWNLRSQHIGAINWANPLDSVFARASRGIEQVVCLWGHLPETDFCENLEKIDSVAHRLESQYGETFEYCTAIEAMQTWLKTDDNIAPGMTLTESGSNDAFHVEISVSEPIFQKYPYVAVKDIYENYYKMECIPSGNLSWRTSLPLNKEQIVKIGVAVCDSVGNQTLDFLEYLPDDEFIDNIDDNYHEISGDWKSTGASSWGEDARYSPLSSVDTVVVEYNMKISKSAFYNIFYQIPNINNLASNYIFQIISNDEIVKTVQFTDKLPEKKWNYIATTELDESQENKLRIQVPADDQITKQAVLDVVKISPLVRDYDLEIDYNHVDFGNVSINVPITKNITLKNQGHKSLKINDIYFENNLFEITETPTDIPGMSEIDLEVSLYSDLFGEIVDTLIIVSNDANEPVKKIGFSADVKTYFLVLDNEDSLHYFESGEWNTSNSQAFGVSSRYSWLKRTPSAFAKFATRLDFQGLYDIEFIVPKTVNASNHTLYKIAINNVVIDSLIIDQNENSGDWVKLGRYFLPTNYDVTVKMEDLGKYSGHAQVLRADAVRFSMIEDLTDIDHDEIIINKFELAQNYPNPFNGSTTIQYSIPSNGKVNLAVYNLIGQEIDVLVNGNKTPGHYKINWTNSQLSTGVYIYRLRFKDKTISRRFILVK